MNDMISNFFLLVQIQAYVDDLFKYNYDFSFAELGYQSNFNLQCEKKNLNNDGLVACKQYTTI